MDRKEDHNTRHIFRRYRTWWVTLLVLSVLLSTLRLSLQSKWILMLVKNRVTALADSSLNAQIRIGSLNGDLWSRIRATDITVTDPDTILHIDTLSVAYSLLDLIGTSKKLYSLSVDGGFARIRQNPDRTWNVISLIRNPAQPVDTANHTSFIFERLNLSRTDIAVTATNLFPKDSTFAIHDLTMNSRLAFGPRSYSFTLNRLDFQVESPALPGPVTIQTAAHASNGNYRLGQLLVGFGSSLMHMHGNYDRAKGSPVFNAEIKGTSLSWKYIRSLIARYPLTEDLNARVILKGNPGRATLDVKLNGPHLTDLDLETVLHMKPEPALEELRIRLGKTEFNKLLNDSLLPEVGRISADFKGDVPFRHYRQGHLEGTATVENAIFAGRRINRITLILKGDPDRADVTLSAVSSRQQVLSHAVVNSPWSEHPVWHSKTAFRNFNPAFWTGDTTYDGRFSIDLTAGGTGLRPATANWNMTAIMLKSRFRYIPIDSAVIRARYVNGRAIVNTAFQTGNGQIRASGNLITGKHPSYTFSAESRKLNLSFLPDLHDLPTSLNLNVTGKGQDLKPDLMNLRITAAAYSSIVNGERLDTLRAVMTLNKGIFKLDGGRLQSQIAAGRFSARLNTTDLYDTQNEMHYDLNLKDIRSLAPFVKLHTLQSTGSLNGKLGLRDSTLEFTGNLALNNAVFDSLGFRSLDGNLTVNFKKNITYETRLHVRNPRIGSVLMQDFRINSQGYYRKHMLNGNYDLNIQTHENVGSRQQGSFHLAQDSAAIHITSFTIQTSLRELALVKPFDIYYTGNDLITDTLDLSTNNKKAFFRLKISHWNKDHKNGYLKARELNLASIQEIYMGKTTLGGILSGQVKLDMAGKNLRLESGIRLAGVDYESLKLDSLKLNAVIQDQHLSATGVIQNDGVDLVEGRAEVPFRYGNPVTFDTTFFEQKVSGELRLHPVKLSVYHSFLAKLGWGDLTGTVQFDGSLSGRAGSPDINGKLRMENSRLSNFDIDSLTTAFNYNHAQHQLQFKGKVISGNQQALNVNGEVPFYCDFRRFKIRFPGKTDSLRLFVTSNNFNLEALNNFIPKRLLTNISGRLNALVRVSGTIGNPVMNGNISLDKAAANIIPAGITVSKGSGYIAFKPDSIIIRHFSASSKGTISTNGDIELKGWKASRFNLAVDADNFRVMNTRDYRGTISMHTRLTGTPAGPQLNGNVTIDQGEIYLDNFGGKQVEPVTLKAAGPANQSPLINLAMYDSLRMDVTMDIRQDFWVRNRTSPEVGLELKGNLNASKQPADSLHLFGELQTIRGYVSPLGKRFDLRKGVMQFSGNPYNPGLDIQSVYRLREPNDITIYYNIGGTIKDPKFTYDSDPKMDLKNIVSYTLFGQPFNSLLAWQQTVAGSSSGTKQASEAALNLLAGQLESLASRELNLDVVQIDNSGRTSGNGTTIKAGKYITNRIFIAVLQQLGGTDPTSEVILQYLIKNNLQLILTQSGAQKTGIDLEWNYSW